MKRLIVLSGIFLLLMPVITYSYPNGTPFYVTDSTPFCASCHSAAKAEYMPELPDQVSSNETAEHKHYDLIRSQMPPSPYLELTGDQKEKIIKDAKLIDSNTSVSLQTPSKVKKGEKILVTIRFSGGNGPVVGIMLVDRPLRYQARPVSSDGWSIVGEPIIEEQNGNIQKTWLDRRIRDSKRNLNHIQVFDQKMEIDKGIFPSGAVVYTLKAPDTPGTYSLTAAYLYGTENTNKAGFFQRPSGRILFSEEKRIQVE